MVDDYAAIEHDIDRSRILMGVVIPRDYSQELGAGPRGAGAAAAGRQRFQHRFDRAGLCGIAGAQLLAGVARRRR